MEAGSFRREEKVGHEEEWTPSITRHQGFKYPREAQSAKYPQTAGDVNKQVNRMNDCAYFTVQLQVKRLNVDYKWSATRIGHGAHITCRIHGVL